MKPAERRNCRHCGRKIIVCLNQSGEAVALDADAKVYDLMKDPDSGEEFALRSFASFVTHFATCPVAGDAAKRSNGE